MYSKIGDIRRVLTEKNVNFLKIRPATYTMQERNLNLIMENIADKSHLI